MKITIIKQLNYWTWKLILSGKEYSGSALTRIEALSSACKLASHTYNEGQNG